MKGMDKWGCGWNVVRKTSIKSSSTSQREPPLSFYNQFISLFSYNFDRTNKIYFLCTVVINQNP